MLSYRRDCCHQICTDNVVPQKSKSYCFSLPCCHLWTTGHNVPFLPPAHHRQCQWIWGTSKHLGRAAESRQVRIAETEQVLEAKGQGWTVCTFSQFKWKVTKISRIEVRLLIYVPHFHLRELEMWFSKNDLALKILSRSCFLWIWKTTRLCWTAYSWGCQ